jgi:hypothetical protein
MWFIMSIMWLIAIHLKHHFSDLKEGFTKTDILHPLNFMMQARTSA